MPELPEVETTVRGLQKEIIGLKILNVWTDLKTKDKRKRDTVANPLYFKIFQKEIKNKKILSVERRAKNILINLSGNKTILIHLKMSGYLFFGKDSKIKFAHVIFTLNSKNYLVFSDSRKFGKITLLNTKEAQNSRHLQNLGPEPLDKNFTFSKFLKRFEKLKKSSRKIKSVLLDQSIIVGIGNIYSDEILWLAHIHPERQISKISETEFKKIFNAMKKTLSKGIHFGGDSMSDYKNIYGLRGNFQLHHKIYQRTGEKCLHKNPHHGGASCSGIIQRKVINNRSAHFCPVCQK